MNEPLPTAAPPARPPRDPEEAQRALVRVQALLERQRRVESLVQREHGARDEARPDEKKALVEQLVHRQHLSELKSIIDRLHPADVAYILEALPRDDRMVVWDSVKADSDGAILIEVGEGVRETLIEAMDRPDLIAAVGKLDADEIASIADSLPDDVVEEVRQSLTAEERAQLRAAMSYPEGSVGERMDYDMVTIRDDVTLEVVLRYLRRFEALPDHTDQVFVVDRDEVLKGALLVDVIREQSEEQALAQAGLREEEDLFASVWNSAKNRWLWLAVNLGTAFFASRVIGVFEGTIEQVVALATLMTVVMGIAGNSGNQTMTLVIRSLALGQVTAGNARRLVLKELAIAALNGAVWGGVAGLLAFWIYHDSPQGWLIGLTMATAMVLNMLVGALVGIFVPLTLERLGRDPAMGSSVLLTFTTDSMGVFIFLGLATLFFL